MIRFPGLDGFRGWLAWVVVLDHVAFFTGIGSTWVSRDQAQSAGALAVTLFIILSGFVITHLVLEKNEPYGLYLARRALRIYPIYLLALLVAIGTTFLTFRTFLTPDGAVDPVAMASIPYPEPGVLLFDRGVLLSPSYFPHLLLHLTMLHGMFAQSFLPNSEFMFLSPAWSLSLEWQFYLVAPFVVRAATNRLGAIGLVVLTLGLFFLYSLRVFGWWGMPSFLPGATQYFAIGIVSRLLITRRPFRFSVWAAASLTILVAGFVVMGVSRLPAAIWIVFFAASLYRYREGRLGTAIGRIYAALFETRLARHLGNASYSTYLMHFPLLQIWMFVAVRVLALAPTAACLFVAASTVVSTWAVSQLTYRWVELPFIARGKRLRGKGSPDAEPAVANA